jgi:inosine triphosphate pyrophosphatase
MAPKTLNFITGNANKLTEVQAILGGVVDLQSQKLDLVEIQGTIEEISADKCRRAADAVRDKFYLMNFQIGTGSGKNVDILV